MQQEQWGVPKKILTMLQNILFLRDCARLARLLILLGEEEGLRELPHSLSRSAVSER